MTAPDSPEPAGPRPGEAQPDETQPDETKPGEAQPDATRLAEPRPGAAAEGGAGRVSRRRFVGVAAGVVGAAAVGFGSYELVQPAESGTLLPSALAVPGPFTKPLPIPAVLAPTSKDATTDYYDVTIKTGTQEILPGVQTEIWGYNGTFPGPTFRTTSGRQVVVRVANQLPVPTVVHLHGGVTPEDSDGYPTDLVYPVGYTGSTTAMPDMPGMSPSSMADPNATVSVGKRTYTYPNVQPAATLWYHDHRMDFTGPSVWRGLAGFHLITDDAESALPLPTGDRDIPLMISDRSFAADGSLAYPSVDPTLLKTAGVTSKYMSGVLGDVIVVNGAAWPVLDVDRARYRFRILNASNARRYKLALDPAPSGSGGGLVQVGSDVGLLGAPVAHDAIEIAPAERFDVVVDFSRYQPGQQVTLVNQLDSGATGQVMRFQVSGNSVADQSSVPAKLVDFETLTAADATVTRTFLFSYDGSQWKVNGKVFDPTVFLAQPEAGATEIWQFITDVHHPVHLHLAHFQVLSRDGGDPGPYDAGWKDTVDVLPSQGVRVVARFPKLPGRYVFHCHNLEHEDMAMMANFKIV